MRRSSVFALVGAALVFESVSLAAAVPGSLRIEADHTAVAMGRSVVVTAMLQAPAGQKAQDYVLLPYGNERRWGSHERPDAQGKAEFLLPLPNPGPARVQVIAMKADAGNWMGIKDMNLLLAGRPMPEGGLRSNPLNLNVTRRRIAPHANGSTLFCIQWEPWFTPQEVFWRTAQAVPVFGFYESYNRDVLRQQVLWFMDLGVDFIMADWSNHIWGRNHWDERHDSVNTILLGTTLMLETLADMRDEGLPVPKMSLLTGLSNGKPTSMQALNEEHEWVYQNYLRNPRFRGLWQEYEGKPLIMPLDTGAMGNPKGTAASAFVVPFFKDTLGMSAEELDAMRANEKTPVDERHFTVRWISSQNQLTHHNELGYWSWMDGSLKPVVTYKDGKAEAVTVTPAELFGPLGWTGEGAYGRREGWTYLETFQTALETRPRVVFLHQFQECFPAPIAEQSPWARTTIFIGDTYSVELSDDLEPVSLTAPGYRGDRGGWGYFYLNLTQALMGVYRDEGRTYTALAVRNPQIDDKAARVEWSAAGKRPAGYRPVLDGETVSGQGGGPVV